MQERNVYVSQKHNGKGNNELTFKDNKFNNFELQQVTQHVIELAPDNIRKPLSNAISFIAQGKQNDADLIINTLEATNSLNHEASVAILALKVLSSEIPEPEFVKTLVENKSYCQNPFVLDLLITALLKNDVANGNLDTALERYEDSSSNGNLTNNFFLRWLANSESIQRFYDIYSLDLTDDTLIAIAYGYLRVGALNDAAAVIDKLNAVHELPHVKKLAYHCSAARLNRMLNERHYWIIDLNEKKVLDKVIEESKHYINNQEIDSDIINVVSSCLYHTDCEDRELVELCFANDNILNQFPKDVREQLQFMKSGDPNVFSDKGLVEFREVRTNSDVKASITKKIKEELKLNSLQYHNILDLFSKEQLRKLLDVGLDVDSDDEFTKRVCKLRLTLISNDNLTEPSRAITLVNSVIQDLEVTGKTILPPTLLSIAGGLQKLKLFEQAIKLIELCLPKEAWLSPLYDFYLELLFQTKQYGKLTKTLGSIAEADWNFNCWALRVNLHQINGDLDAEINTLENLVKRYKNNISLWNTLTSAYERAGAKTKIIELPHLIPTALFDKPSSDAWRILFSLMKNGLFKFIEPIVLKWFIEDPEIISEAITNFALQGTFSGVEYDFSLTVGNIRSCYVLRDVKGEEKLKLIIDGYDGKHRNLLDSQSPHAQSLLQCTVNDTVRFGVEEFTITEIAPPFLGAAWRIAPKIRAQQNDGSDVFQLLELSSDESKNIADSVAQLISKLKPKKEPNEIQKHPQLPIQIKGYWLSKTDAFESAVQTFIDKDCIKNQIPVTDSTSQTLILDLYSVAFISLLGLYETHSFTDRNYFITPITKSLLESWLGHSKKEHLRASVGPAGKLILSNEKHILNQRLVKGVEFILENTSLIQTQLEDIPIGLVNLEDFMDSSTFSSLCACSQLGYDYLSFDNNFVMLFKDSDLTFANAYELYLTSLDQLSLYEQQSNLYLLNMANVNVPVRYKTLTSLASTNRSDALSLIAQIIKGWKPNARDGESFINLLSLLVLAGIRHKLFSGNIIADSAGTKLIFTTLSCARLDKVEKGFTEDLVITLLLKVLEISPQEKRFWKFIKAHFDDFAICSFLDLEYINQEVIKLLAKPINS
ncbi:hypothetical protein CWC02_01675 [Pseudoalteromonas sp. S2721]|uniref:hypothetical protein n=1 Tax=Pseudoalteromonas sp. S2721 TaxID=579526 RepID=UPI00110AF3C7|nr:hypothetical protein [Pseudoalteromonas sp. S2721]TMP21261.1 hypothetical protein CWC02_01675 [Pseudoalteromonas sp. S2721]